MTETATETSYTWLRKIPGELYNLDEKPLLGFPPPFPWNSFSVELGKSLQISGITLSPGEIAWRPTNELFDGLGDKLKAISLNVSPLSGGIWWVMPEKGYAEIMESLLGAPAASKGETVEDAILQAFSQFIAAEAITAFQKIDFDKKLSPVVLSVSELPAEPCLSLDVTINFKQQPIYGRLLLSPAFRKSWATHYLKDQKALALISPVSDALNVIVHIEAGKIPIKPSEWQKIAPGDFIILDNCTIDPDEDKAKVMLVIDGHPYFRGKIKDGNIKILEHPLYQEVDTAMSTPPKDPNEEDFNDADFDLDDDKEKKAKGKADESDDELDLDDLSEIEVSAPAPAETPKPAAAKAKAPAVLPPPAKSGPLSIDEIPLPVVIEVGRIQISVKKLLELQPGNMLELDIHPESGVDMVINGKRVARGELLKIGDTLGLRVTELS